MIRQLTIGGATAALVLAVLVIVSSQEKTLGQQAGAQAGSQGGGFGGGGFGGGGIGGGNLGIRGAAGSGGGSYGIGGVAGGQIRPRTSATYEPEETPIDHGIGRRGREDRVSTAQRKLMEADSDEARQTAEKELREALVAEFDADMQRRAEELESIRKRVADMEAVLEKRTDAKDEIIDLRLEVLRKEAEGLGWTANRRSQSRAEIRHLPSLESY